MWQSHICHSVGDPHVRGNSVNHCVAGPQKEMKEMKATNSSESYGCLRQLAVSVASSTFEVALKATNRGQN